MSTTELSWFKSSYSGDSSGDRVEVATRPATIHVHDSKNTTGARLALTPVSWTEFVVFAARERG